MSLIYFNNVLYIHAPEYELVGVHRVIAICQTSQEAAVVPLIQDINNQSKTNQVSTKDIDENIKVKPPLSRCSSIKKVDLSVLKELEEAGEIRELELVLNSKLHQSINNLNEKEEEIAKHRHMTMKPFFNQKLLTKHIFSVTGIGSLVASEARKNGVSRAAVYNWFSLLLTYGFASTSLNPRYDLCGAVGEKRFKSDGRKKSGRKTNLERIVGENTYPQKMVEKEEFEKIIALYKQIKTPKKSNEDVYIEIVNMIYSIKISISENGIDYSLPETGTYINRRQYRHILDGMNKIEKLLLSTTSGHYKRNQRGQSGKSHQNVAGPGHLFAVDSTIADVFLRSSVNRAWVCGRPVVYIIVDVWSCAIVGFYVCWTGPSWSMAKVALFSAAGQASTLSTLWGCPNWLYLDPVPTLPFEFLCDRGEYLSLAAMESALESMFSLSYNPSLRPDLKGIVEVLHRIVKDEQYAYIPGAIDARRKEMELRKYNPKAASLTLKEYVEYLIVIFNKYNNCADLRGRLDLDMIADNVVPTPVGLWSWGHQVGLGYRKNTNAHTLIKNLLPTGSARINKKGLFFGGQPYESVLATSQQWSTLARNFGASETQVHYFPGSISKIWLPEGPSGLTEFTLSPYAAAKPNISLDELLDAQMVEKLKSQDREYQRTFNALIALKETNKIITNAVLATAEAELVYSGLVPSISEARKIEVNSLGGFNNLHSSLEDADLLAQAESNYSNLINGILTKMNDEDSNV